MSEPRLVDVTGRLRSPAAIPGHWEGCAPPDKGQRYPADPPTVQEIILVMRQAGPGRYADRTRGLIAILWRAGLRDPCRRRRCSWCRAATHSAPPSACSVCPRAGAIRDIAAPAGASCLLLRPEQLVVSASATDSATPATVIEIRYHGHDAMARLRLEALNGLPLLARIPGRAPARARAAGVGQGHRPGSSMDRETAGHRIERALASLRGGRR